MAKRSTSMRVMQPDTRRCGMRQPRWILQTPPPKTARRQRRVTALTHFHSLRQHEVDQQNAERKQREQHDRQHQQVVGRATRPRT